MDLPFSFKESDGLDEATHAKEVGHNPHDAGPLSVFIYVVRSSSERPQAGTCHSMICRLRD